jgi:hypothetical protein
MKLEDAMSQLVSSAREPIFSNTGKFVSNDPYLADLVIDWSNATGSFKEELYKEIASYTYEAVRSASNRK